MEDEKIILSSPPGMFKGPTYEHAARFGDFIFVAGQVAKDIDGKLIAPDDAAAFWVLVSDSMALPTKPDDLTQEPKVAALYADVRSALGQDNRFEPTFPVIMTERFASHTAVDEPISGFVRVPPGAFVMGHKTEKTNPPRSVRIYDTFYIARTLTTVAQYALFVKALGYNSDEAIWCGHGLEWMTRNQYLQPRDWPQRLTRQNHPVTSITWFEARAYAQWLSTQLRKTLDSVGLKGYEARLPTDAQWERASRASSLSAAHVWRWPWGDDASNIAQRANIDLTAAPRTITGVGLFAPNQIGLHDMAGNVWEWMDNRADSSGNSDFAAVGRAERYEEIRNQSLSLRGGSWLSPPEYATCAYSGGYLPDKTDRSVGLRIVLSVAQSAKRET